MQETPHRLLGVACLLGALTAFTLQDAAIKWMSTGYPLHELVLIRTCIAMGPMLILVRLEGGLRLLRSTRPLLHLTRGALLVVTNTAFFAALAAIPLAEATAIFFVAPLLITAASACILREQVGPRRWLAVAVGLAGVVVILRPGDGAMQWVGLLPLVAATTYALLQITTRALGVTDRASVMAFYVQLTFMVVSTGMWLIAGDGRFAPDDDPSLRFLLREWVVPARGDYGLLLGIGLLNAAGGYLISQAYRVSAPAVVAPFEYLALPFAVLWGLLLFDEWPDSTAMLGIVIIVASGLYVLHRESARSQSKRAAGRG